MADYKIELGIGLNSKDFEGLQTKIKGLEDEVKINLNTKDANEKIKKLQEGLQNLGKDGSDNIFNLDTKALMGSLDKVRDAVIDIKNAFGSLDTNNTKNLVTSVNQIASAIEKATNESDGLLASLKKLSQKDFSVNLDLKLGGSSKGNNPVANNAAYRNYVETTVKPQLEAQAKALMNAVKKKYSDYWWGAQDDAWILEDIAKKKGYQSDVSPVVLKAETLKKNSLIGQMSSMRDYLNSVEEFARASGVDVDSVVANFSQSRNELIQRALDIQSGVKTAAESTEDSIEKFNKLFKTGIDAEGLNGVLEPITKNLADIKQAFESLSSIGTIDGLTVSFKELSEVLEKLTSNITVVKQNLDNISSVGGNAGNIGTGVESLEQNLKQTTNAAEQTADAVREVNNEAKKINNISIDIFDGNIEDVKNALRNIGIDDTSIEKATKELNELNITAKNVSATLRDGNLIKVDVKGVENTVDGLERAITATTTFGEKAETTSIKYSQAFDKIINTAQKAKAELADTGANGLSYQIENIRKEAEKFVGTSGDLREAINRVDIAFENLKTADEVGETKALANAYEELEKAIKQANSQLAKSKQIEKDANAAKVLKQEKSILNNQMETWLRENTRAAKDYGDEIRRLQVSLDSLDADGVKRVRKQFQAFKTDAKAFEKTGLTVFDSLKKKVKEYSTYFSAAELFMYAEEALRSMFEQVKLIDSAMTELKKVTDETDESYQRFLTNAADRAKVIGTTIDGLVESTADFAKLGYGFKDAQELAEVANIYAVVGDEVEGVEGATESLISTMAAFKNEMNGLDDGEFALSIVDKMNEVANRYSITSGGLGEALQRSASSMAAAQNTLDETIALTTAANEVVNLCHAM